MPDTELASWLLSPQPPYIQQHKGFSQGPPQSINADMYVNIARQGR